MARTRIVVLGGGFGGVYTALHLERLLGSSAEITLVSRENFFLFTPMLHEVAASDIDIRTWSVRCERSCDMRRSLSETSPRSTATTAPLR
jgi:NADH dehydrogenase FAD-containing subunit